jgi:hypothetical protein
MSRGLAFAQHVDVRVEEEKRGVEGNGREDDRRALADRHLVFEAEEDDYYGDDLADDAERADEDERA